MVLGTDHAEVGAQILTQWSFPRDVVDAVRWHHDPDFPEKNAGAAADILYLADFLCQADAAGNQTENYGADLSPAVIERLGLDTSQLQEVKARVAQWAEELSDALTFN